MKIILTLTTMFCLLFTSVYLVELAAQEHAEEPPIHQNGEHIEPVLKSYLQLVRRFRLIIKNTVNIRNGFQIFTQNT